MILYFLLRELFLYTTAQNVRDLLGVDIDTAGDAILEEFIEYAQDYVREYIQIPIIDGKLSGNIDSKNNTFETTYTFWADVSGDTLITTADFTVWGWRKTPQNVDDPFQRDELSVSTFDPLRGIVVLASAPSEDVYRKITMDYSYYTKAINWKLLALATTWKAAELWVKREEFLVPEDWKMGTKTIRQRQPWRYYEIEFNRVMDKLRALPMSKVEYKKLVFRPRGPDRPQVDTTAAKEIKEKGQYTRPVTMPKVV